MALTSKSHFGITFLFSTLLWYIVYGDFCSPNPCGPNTDCKILSGIPTCLCKDTYYGDDPIEKGCKRECENNNECKGGSKCLNYQCIDCIEHTDCLNSIKSTCFANRCVDICKEVKCGIGAKCETTATHQALCYCQPGDSGNPSIKCE